MAAVIVTPGGYVRGESILGGSAHGFGVYGDWHFYLDSRGDWQALRTEDHRLRNIANLLGLDKPSLRRAFSTSSIRWQELSQMTVMIAGATPGIVDPAWFGFVVPFTEHLHASKRPLERCKPTGRLVTLLAAPVS